MFNIFVFLAPEVALMHRLITAVCRQPNCQWGMPHALMWQHWCHFPYQLYYSWLKLAFYLTNDGWKTTFLVDVLIFCMFFLVLHIAIHSSDTFFLFPLKSRPCSKPPKCPRHFPRTESEIALLTECCEGGELYSRTLDAEKMDVMYGMWSVWSVAWFSMQLTIFIQMAKIWSWDDLHPKNRQLKRTPRAPIISKESPQKSGSLEWFHGTNSPKSSGQHKFHGVLCCADVLMHLFLTC